MKGRLIKAPKFNMSVHEPTPITPSPSGALFSIGADPKEELSISLSTLQTNDTTFDQPYKKPPVKYVSQRLKLAKTFKQELAKMGTSGQQLMDLNPIKSNRSRANSPEVAVAAVEKGLPFQRRARSFSPPKEPIQLAHNLNLFPMGPVAPVKLLGMDCSPTASVKPQSKSPRPFHSSGKKLCDDLLASHDWVDCDSDEDLKVIKADYCKMLQQAPLHEDEFTYSEFEKIEDDEWQDLLEGGDLQALTSQLRRGRTRNSIRFL